LLNSSIRWCPALALSVARLYICRWYCTSSIKVSGTLTILSLSAIVLLSSNVGTEVTIPNLLLTNGQYLPSTTLLFNPLSDESSLFPYHPMSDGGGRDNPTAPRFDAESSIGQVNPNMLYSHSPDSPCS